MKPSPDAFSLGWRFPSSRGRGDRPRRILKAGSQAQMAPVPFEWASVAFPAGGPLHEPADERQNLQAVPFGRSDQAAELAAFTVEQQSSRSRSEEHTSELQSLMPIPYAVLCLKQ